MLFLKACFNKIIRFFHHFLFDRCLHSMFLLNIKRKLYLFLHLFLFLFIKTKQKTGCLWGPCWTSSCYKEAKCRPPCQNIIILRWICLQVCNGSSKLQISISTNLLVREVCRWCFSIYVKPIFMHNFYRRRKDEKGKCFSFFCLNC